MPMYGNKAETQIGIYIKDFLKQIGRDAHLNMSKSLDIILFICAEGLEINKERNLGYQCVGEDSVKMTEFYKEYVRYYKLIK